MTESPFKRKCEHASELLGLIHSNVCSLMCIQTRGVLLYFVTFIDDHSRFKKLRNNLVKSIMILRLDQGNRFLNQVFKDYQKDNGIV